MKKKYDEYMSTIKKVEELFLMKDEVNFIKKITFKKDYHERFENKIFGYISSVLNSQQAMLGRNRALFLAINLGLVGLVTKIIYEYSIKECNSDIAINTGVYTLVLSVMGLASSYLWGVTTYYRRHKVWFLESLLVCLEQGYVLNNESGGPIKMINFIDDKVKVNILNQPDSVSCTVINCEARKTFKFLRLGFVAVFGAGVFLSFFIIASLYFFLNYPCYGIMLVIICFSILISIIYMFVSSWSGL